MEEEKGLRGEKRKPGGQDESAKRLSSMTPATKLSRATIGGGRGEFLIELFSFCLSQPLFATLSSSYLTHHLKGNALPMS